jgi:ribonucleoside-diphosphate reductase alpha subunit
MEALLNKYEPIIANFVQKVNDTNKSVLITDKDAIINSIMKKATNAITEFQLCELITNDCEDKILQNPNYSNVGALILNYINESIRQEYVNDKESFIKTYIAKTDYLFKNLPGFIVPEYHAYVTSPEFLVDFQDFDEFVYELPFFVDIFGYKTLDGSYLMKVNGVIIENVIDTFMRVAVAVQFRALDLSREEIVTNIKIAFTNMKHGKYIHATPTMYNAGTTHEQLSSCYLLKINDSLKHIYKVNTDVAFISKGSGGAGIDITDVRAKNSPIRGTNGVSSGVLPMLKLFNANANYVNQGGKGTKRPGAIAAYIEPWHADIKSFLEAKLPIGDEKLRARDLFFALWIPDLFMKQLENDGDWYLMCPNLSPGLHDVYGDEFETLYWKYVEEGRYTEKLNANDIFSMIIISITGSGLPYLMHKDNVNRRSNQSNIGVIKCSNLCTEITEYCDEDNHAVCNLASICVNRFVREDKTYDYEGLFDITRSITRSLNNIIDINMYPTPECKNSNMNARPIGIGIQGIANLFYNLELEYESQESIDIESKIMETIYYGALTESHALAQKYGKYDFFDGSPFSQGIFQHDMAGKTTGLLWDWESLRAKIMADGTRNSLVTALMPTASTSQIMNNYECFEIPIGNMAIRKTSVGLFKVVNRQMIEKLASMGLWNDQVINKIIKKEGSIQEIDSIPDSVKKIYKIIYEIKQKHVLNHAIARAPFVDQSQSMNLYFETIEPPKVKGAMIYAWKNGLKTGSYYMHSKPASKPTDTQGNVVATEVKSSESETKTNNPEASTVTIGASCSLVAMRSGACDSCSA